MGKSEESGQIGSVEFSLLTGAMLFRGVAPLGFVMAKVEGTMRHVEKAASASAGGSAYPLATILLFLWYCGGFSPCRLRILG
jgi:hypothetical protein